MHQSFEFVFSGESLIVCGIIDYLCSNQQCQYCAIRNPITEMGHPTSTEKESKQRVYKHCIGTARAAVVEMWSHIHEKSSMQFFLFRNILIFDVFLVCFSRVFSRCNGFEFAACAVTECKY